MSLFPLDLPRRKSRVLMHADDAGQGHARFTCRTCKISTGWIAVTKLRDVMRGKPCPRCNSKRAIVTSNICPPIPMRQFDWCAHFDDDEESGCNGYGRTEFEAIDDLLTNFGERGAS